MPELPASLTQPAKEPVIYTIPEQFYGVAAKAQLSKEAAAPAPAPTPQVPGASAVPGASVVPPKESKKWLLIPVFALLFLALFGFAAWWFLQPKAAPAPAAPSVTLPAPESQPQPAPEPEPQPQPEPATATTETPVVPAPEADADGDGLTTAEETLYGTNPDNTDSDADGFSDSVEVINLYNPAGFKPTKLIEAGLVTSRDEPTTEYQVLSPTSWAWADANTLYTTEFLGPGEYQKIVFNKEENPQSQSVIDWYLSRNPDISPVEVQQFFTKSGLEGVRSPDGFTAYIALNGSIYRITYEIPIGRQPFYKSTFTMILNSFSQKP